MSLPFAPDATWVVGLHQLTQGHRIAPFLYGFPILHTALKPRPRTLVDVIKAIGSKPLLEGHVEATTTIVAIAGASAIQAPLLKGTPNLDPCFPRSLGSSLQLAPGGLPTLDNFYRCIRLYHSYLLWCR